MSPGGAYVVWVALVGSVVVALAARSRSPARWQIPVVALAGAAAIVAFAVVSWGRATPFGDFNKAYYPAGSAILSAPSTLYACEVGNLCFVNLPIVALLFTPLSLLDRAVAQIVFTVAGAAAVAGAVRLSVRHLPPGSVHRYAIASLFVLSGPLLYSARLGNITHMMVPLAILAFVWLIDHRDGRAGALLGLLAVLKPPLLLFLPYLVARRRAAASLAFCATMAAIAILSVALFGFDLHRQWLAEFVGPFSSRPVGAYNVQSIAGLLAHFFYPSALADWEPLTVPHAFRVFSTTASAAVVAASAAALYVSGRPTSAAAQWAELSIVLVVILLVSPVTWTHYYAFCLIPLARYLDGTLVVAGAAGRTAVGLGFVLVSAPVVLALPDDPWLHMLAARVLISHYVVGALVLLGVLSVTVTAREGLRSAHDLPRRLVPG